jgi:hypothetical protein
VGYEFMKFESPFSNLKCPECKGQCLHVQVVAVVNADQISDTEFSSELTLGETLSLVWDDDVYTWCCKCEWEGDISECSSQ